MTGVAKHLNYTKLSTEHGRTEGVVKPPDHVRVYFAAAYHHRYAVYGQCTLFGDSLYSKQYSGFPNILYIQGPRKTL